MAKLLAVVAHPDDESGSFGGTLALYASRGVEVEVICATRGESARNRGNCNSATELAETRQREFERACQVLGVTWCDIWNYPDGGLNRTTLADIGARLCRAIRQRRPEVMITQGPEGGFTGHADHSAISHFATFGFHAAGRQDLFQDCGPAFRPSRLYYVTGPGSLPEYPQVTFSPITAEIDISSTFERKIEAFECHTTQAPLFERFRRATERFRSHEYFHLAAGGPRRSSGVEHDLFT